jgi:hypothetical protein
MLRFANKFKYAIIKNNGPPEYDITLDLDTTVFNHIAFEYDRNKLTVWINGMSKKSTTTELGNITDIKIGVQELGIISLYNRNLVKPEIIQHYIDHHVENFTYDKVLI